jgi:hypothetical protein
LAGGYNFAGPLLDRRVSASAERNTSYIELRQEWLPIATISADSIQWRQYKAQVEEDGETASTAEVNLPSL